jgi:hypothetical protein
VWDPKTPEGQKRLLEARMSATPKSAYVKAILLHCRECYGVVPVRTDCGGHTLGDGDGACRLYQANTPDKCRKLSKSALRKIILSECRYCMQSAPYKGTPGNPIEVCTSPDCRLYPFGPGRKQPRGSAQKKLDSRQESEKFPAPQK